MVFYFKFEGVDFFSIHQSAGFPRKGLKTDMPPPVSVPHR